MHLIGNNASKNHQIHSIYAPKIRFAHLRAYYMERILRLLSFYTLFIAHPICAPLFSLLHLLEGGEGFFHDGVDAGGDLFVGHVYFAAGRRLDAELGYISKWIGDFA